jgi:hypothetical protein
VRERRPSPCRFQGPVGILIGDVPSEVTIDFSTPRSTMSDVAEARSRIAAFGWDCGHPPLYDRPDGMVFVRS